MARIGKADTSRREEIQALPNHHYLYEMSETPHVVSYNFQARLKNPSAAPEDK